MANCFKLKRVANIDDFTTLVRCGAVQGTTESTPCRSPTLSTAVFRIIQEIQECGNSDASANEKRRQAFMPAAVREIELLEP
jgi:hypothetical protein